jgi:hypothetical protein
VSDFGDYDPEDAWDDGDAIDLKLAILERVVRSLRDHRDDRLEARRSDALRLVRKLEDQHVAAARSEGDRLAGIRGQLEAL